MQTRHRNWVPHPCRAFLRHGWDTTNHWVRQVRGPHKQVFVCGVEISLLRSGILLVLLPVANAVSAQLPLIDSQQHSTAKTQAVEYLFPEQVSVPAGQSSPVALHFRIRPDLHINSHTPRADYLIPTFFSIPEASGVRLESASYPAGADFTLPVDPATKMSVYTGEFAINARVIASPGDHLVEAKLRYQACDQNACLPPKTITVPIDVIGK
jgi:Thiol:disulfide interchange protein DsbD, N-terminal